MGFFAAWPAPHRILFQETRVVDDTWERSCLGMLFFRRVVLFFRRVVLFFRRGDVIRRSLAP